MAVFAELRQGDIPAARRALGMIVGRDTAHLESPEIVRGTVETVAENIVDAIISPLFFALLGGAPLAMAYRAVNTLDSMVGYKNDKYRDLGWASARLDDVVNYIPARFTALLLTLCAALLRWTGGDAGVPCGGMLVFIPARTAVTRNRQLPEHWASAWAEKMYTTA